MDQRLVKRADLLQDAKEYLRENRREAILPKDESAQSTMGLLKRVLTNRKELSEFLTFVRNGFRLRSAH